MLARPIAVAKCHSTGSAIVPRRMKKLVTTGTQPKKISTAKSPSP